MLLNKIYHHQSLSKLMQRSLIVYQHRSCHHKQKPESNDDNNKSNDNFDEKFDIVINGGGIVGFSLFTAIRSLPFLSKKKVLLIEQQSPPRLSPLLNSSSSSGEKTNFSNRVSSITLGSKEFFEQLSIWNKLRPYAKKVQGMYVWSDHYQNGINFRPENSFDETMCYILENHRILQSLHERINELPNDNQEIRYKTSVIDIFQDVDISNTSATINLKTIDLSDPDQKTQNIQTKLLIGCDGFKSIVRSKSTLPYFEVDLEQMGIVGTLEIESTNNDNSIAFQRFISDELVIALLPLDNNHSSLVLSIPKKSVGDWMKLPDADFVLKLNNELIKETRILNPLDKLASAFNLNKLFSNNVHTRPPFIRSIMPKSRAAYPLGFGTTVPFLVGTIQTKVPLLQHLMNKEKRVNTALIGDAAHRIHPLAGQGLNLGIGDASILASSLESKLSAGFDLFQSTVDSSEILSQALFDFERSRILKLVPMLAGIHSMQTLFKYTPPTILTLANQFDMGKNLIVSFANSR